MATRITKAPADLATADTTIKQYAGKINLAEVLVTRLRRLDDNTYTVALRWPRTHAFYAPTHQGYNPLLFVESVRQSLSVISYGGLDVPMEHRMSWEFLGCEVVRTALYGGTVPAAVEIDVRLEPVTRRRLGSIRFAARAHATRDGLPLGTAELKYTAHPPAIYRRLRGRNASVAQAGARTLPPPPPIPATLAGRTSERDVVLARGDGPRRWLLRADVTHPILFDHPHDHIPGMVLLEAACQAVQADAAPARITPIALTSTFFRYVELDLLCWIIAGPADTDERGRRRQMVSGVQGDKVVFSVVIASEPTVT
jgi:hypothetical protein